MKEKVRAFLLIFNLQYRNVTEGKYVQIFPCGENLILFFDLGGREPKKIDVCGFRIGRKLILEAIWLEAHEELIAGYLAIRELLSGGKLPDALCSALADKRNLDPDSTTLVVELEWEIEGSSAYLSFESAIVAKVIFIGDPSCLNEIVRQVLDDKFHVEIYVDEECAKALSS